MLKILSYLRKTSISVIIIVLLLCVQAAADLALPDYTSKIVNIGIQQNGIENQTWTIYFYLLKMMKKY